MVLVRVMDIPSLGAGRKIILSAIRNISGFNDFNFTIPIF